jgi:TRAP-type C4-dicarboxylate transport system substrate-binding protein
MKGERKMVRKLYFLLAFVICLWSLLSGNPYNVMADMPTLSWRIQTHVTMDPPDILKKYSQELKEMPESLPAWSAAGTTLELARRVKKRTDGKFVLKLYTAGELFKDKEMYEACEKGAVEMLTGYGAYFAGRNPVGYITNNIPFGTGNLEEGYNLVFETDFVNIVRRAYAKNNLYFLFPLEAGVDGFSTKFPVNSIEDMKGKKIRAPGIKGNVCQLLGATPLAISTAEQYTALQRGTIDGVFFPPHVCVTYKLVEQLKYCIWPTILNPTFCEWVVNMDVWKKLPQEYKTVLTEEAASVSKWALKKRATWQAKWSQEQMESFGVKNIYLSKNVYAQFKNACLPLWDEIAKKSAENAMLIQVFKNLSQ